METTSMPPQKLEFEVGSVLKFDQVRYERSINAWKTDLLPIVEDLISEYEKLGLGDFNQKVYNDILADARETEKRFRDDQVKRLKAAKFVIFLNDDNLETEVSKSLANLRKVKGNFFRALDSAKGGIGWRKLDALKLDFDDVTIEKGKAVIVNHNIRSKYETRIENEIQLEIWKEGLKLRNDVEKFLKLIEDAGFDGRHFAFYSGSEYDFDAFFVRLENGEILMDPEKLSKIFNA